MTRPLQLALLLVATSACTTRAVRPSTWQSPLHREHPLVGKVWDVRQQQFVSLEAVKANAREAHFVLLGEMHDNPDHHLLQAELLSAATSSGRKPAVAFEMLDLTQQARVDAALGASPKTPDTFAQAVDWAHSGWPPFEIYRPIFEVAFEAQLPIVAANLSREQARRAMKEGASALDPAVRERLAQDEPVPDEILRTWREEMRSSHCDALPESMIDPLVLAQRARDVQLARRMEDADRGDGAVLIAGAGHVRDDRGVPAVLAKDRPGQSILSIGLLEVKPGELTPDAYAARFGTAALPFDYVVFTPAFERKDPCETFHKKEQR